MKANLDTMTLQDCLEMYQKEGMTIAIIDGHIADILTVDGIPVFAHSKRTPFRQLTIQCDMSGSFPKTTVFVDNKAVDRIAEISFTHEAGQDPVLTMNRISKEGETNGTGKEL